MDGLSTLKPGETSKVLIVRNTSRDLGRLVDLYKVFSNDPKRPMVILFVEAVVVR